MRILANYGYKTNGDSYSVTFETIGDVPAAHAPQTVDELFRLAKDAVQRQVAGATPQPVLQPTPRVTIPQPALSRVEGPVTSAHPVPTNGNGKKPQIKEPGLPASSKQLGLLRRLAREKGQTLPNLTDLTMGEASVHIEQLMAR